MMKGCGYEQNAMAGCEGLRMVVGSVVCPKPRRLGILNPSINDHIRPLRYPTNPFQSEVGDSQAGTELLDIILTKGNSSEIHNNQVASSPPYFCGSPPSRASNPVIQDEQFGNGKVGFVSATPPSPSSARKGGCARMKFGHKPAAVRVEGFDCLSRDRRNRSISAVA
ncbi:hypothetical protein L484_019963 [Morus notabilis]|uniref:Uncharacterized protein n=1 Tax=Morus notabilis TaxID=981085 RepID=W9RJM9_9ROSA|nr:uncharacterized protein LOC21402878 [Morus notabilis]EXB56918.1 hypothetical protein L484_019963 [Morus notabilis]